jgi:glycosyltransferase involved in cell wall biosynthesis
MDETVRPGTGHGSMLQTRSVQVAVLVPCFNEEATVAKVVSDFKQVLPDCRVYVFDNNSSDLTVARAIAAGALVIDVRERGKGNVVRRMFADVEADIYLLVDGDDTYDAAAAPDLIAKLLQNGLDMVVGIRAADGRSAYRLGHVLGNRLLTTCVKNIFGRAFTDMLSGYRVFSRRFVKSFPAHASGFETETELTVHALGLRMPAAEIQTRYGSRPMNSESKLNTYRDGFRILSTIIRLFKAERPLLFFFLGFAACALLSLVLAGPLIATYLETGLVPRLPTALFCASVMLLGTILLVCGIILDSVTLARVEAKRLAYLAIPGPMGLR